MTPSPARTSEAQPRQSPALKMEDDDWEAKQAGRSPSAQLTQQSQTVSSRFATPDTAADVSAPRHEDEDVPMTDAGESTTKTAGKRPRGMGLRSRGGGRGGGSASRGGRGSSTRGGGNGARTKSRGKPRLAKGAGESPLSPSSSPPSSNDNGPYCVCRGPDDHRWMIQCDQCEDWFHGDCVDIDKDIGESVILSYICPNCAVPGRYVTRFRKLCALTTCHRPARLYGEDHVSAAPTDSASFFCCHEHRDQWWDALLGQILHRKSGEAVPADKMPVDLFTPAQLVSVLASTNQEGVARMLLHGLTQESSAPASLLTSEERTLTEASAARRYRLAEQYVMCKKMLELLDMAKSRNYDAIKAGLMERDCCGYDDRLQHVGVQPHFERFMASAEGATIFRAGRLAAPEEETKEKEIKTEGVKAEEDEADDATTEETPPDYEAATAGMCRKRKCKAHLGWFPTLARDVRMQMQDLTREAAAQRDKETRIQQAAAQRAFVKRHMASEVVAGGAASPASISTFE